ncbi:MAG: dinitrogenase iron-molybdenum cofactor biosynthesis protein [Clostridiales bacterium]|nr:dinitrogenase iron-molybdenum cofactor biosynthesis protein [Clostridiales bacterium]
MKIAIPVNSNTTASEVATSFGRAPFYLIHDDSLDSTQLRENIAAHSAGGAGVLAAQIVVDSGAEVLLTPRCGQNAADVLKAAGIKLYKSLDNLSAMDNIKAFEEGRLTQLSEIHKGLHGQAGE